MPLAKDGKLAIDTRVRNYLPELPSLKPEPTLRQCGVNFPPGEYMICCNGGHHLGCQQPRPAIA